MTYYVYYVELFEMYHCHDWFEDEVSLKAFLDKHKDIRVLKILHVENVREVTELYKER